jgi:hypothetical protein
LNLTFGTAVAYSRDMTQPRQIVPERTYLITRRALRRHYLLRPEYFINNLFVFFWAVLAAKYEIEIHAFSIPAVGALLAAPRDTQAGQALHLQLSR